MSSVLPVSAGALLKQSSALFGAVPAAVFGGVAIALLWMKLFPTLRDVDRLE